jgi:hypothetical protein
MCNMIFRIAFDMLSTLFQTILAFLGKSSCFFGFFRFTPKIACHFAPPKREFTNRIQREFDSNGGIAPFDHEPSASTNKPSQTYYSLPLRSGEACCQSSRRQRRAVKLPSLQAKRSGEGLGVRFAPPKREFSENR